MSGILRFPNTAIGKNDDYIMIKILSYKAGGLASGGGFGSLATGSSGNVKQTILLPMPQGVADSNAANWSEQQLNAALAAGIGAGKAAVESGDLIAGTAEAGKKLFEGAVNTFTSGTGQQATSTLFSKLAVGALSGQDTDFGQLLSRATGSVVNPNVELLFQGVNIRTPYMMTFDLVPRTQSEGEQIKSIIKSLKQSMAPKKGSGLSRGAFFVKAPDVFQVTYMTGPREHRFLNKFKTSALTNMSVNYTGAGPYSTYNDSTPVHMIISMQFQELTPIWNEDYEQVEGVGY
jgi:hypothetical protein